MFSRRTTGHHLKIDKDPLQEINPTTSSLVLAKNNSHNYCPVFSKCLLFYFRHTVCICTTECCPAIGRLCFLPQAVTGFETAFLWWVGSGKELVCFPA